MKCFQDILANNPEGTVNKLHQRRHIQKSEFRRFHYGIFPSKHEGSNDASKVFVDINEDSLVTNSDNYVYSDIHCYGMLLNLRTGHSKKILDLVLIQVPIYKIVLAFCGRLRLIPAKELCDKKDITDCNNR